LHVQQRGSRGLPWKPETRILLQSYFSDTNSIQQTSRESPILVPYPLCGRKESFQIFGDGKKKITYCILDTIEPDQNWEITIGREMGAHLVHEACFVKDSLTLCDVFCNL
jgi:hypothetical protein